MSDYEMKLMMPEQEKVKATIVRKYSYRSESNVNMTDDMVGLDLRLKKRDYYKLLKYLDTGK